MLLFRTHFLTLILFLPLFLVSSCRTQDQSKDESDDAVELRSRNADNAKAASSKSSDNNTEDGIHSATVDYNNPETGYSQTYTLDVEVENGEVVRINFPRGGWLDSDHIEPAELDDDGSCLIEGEEGKTYQVQIDE